ncbi:methylated-DNA--[protein]-cysteine S-methyltransferase [Microbulbifer thermotolerans]|uniref:Methylated-DNA--protein-cysteine methyltransferase n=1 Tax=Microbulbifer thermotolerans TaxID=252514 RepID=A0AB35HY02_MICTH|nr:methylated-DNA--[protein]-cysteine S-methyltransferase [Microbulbifer thermotolerans]MCX2779890.1 methylated-DNA--[protein]-cysteine S-methyltransferase [Microbulbifer thermotolerans]MCX2802344.1 methylated-DNA--[protein]-cysteine S-methyltransferase [Microbulbifer thermotolerans]MCX2805197.1 methylated-DNA--[protein]-cysteine S-methyltransferase [Microbulbifer thermotolerans]MCX2830939.1 methylated-DNA--[protein]-cysteine S-methyltransferase [Microbulbifer thermotolerans]MCX2841782.1 methy
MINYEIYTTRFGAVAIAADTRGLVALAFHSDARPVCAGSHWDRRSSALTDSAAGQLEEYFTGKRREFDLPLCPRGTDFQCRVWEALQRIPYGETRSYRQQAEAMGNPKSVRAVARANGANPIAIVIPCHRVIGADGSLTGYAGGLDIKARLLALEGARFVQQEHSL